MFAGGSAESLRWAPRALELPHTDSIAVMTLHIRGNGRLELATWEGWTTCGKRSIERNSGSALDHASPTPTSANGSE